MWLRVGFGGSATQGFLLGCALSGWPAPATGRPLDAAADACAPRRVDGRLTYGCLPGSMPDSMPGSLVGRFSLSRAWEELPRPPVEGGEAAKRAWIARLGEPWGQRER